MASRVIYFFTWVCTLAIILFLNGNITFKKVPIPPLGKFLNPFYGVWKCNSNNEKNNKTISSSLLSDSIQIIYDERRVAHIFANSTQDVLFAQGYAEAQNRLFQMEMLTRVASGNLSEIFGSRTVKLDIAARRRGMQFAAEQAVEAWKSYPNYNLLEYYTAGVNEYIKDAKSNGLPIEFLLLGFEPQEWTVLKTALIFKQMSLTLAGGDRDIEYTNMKNTLSPEYFSFLYPERELEENPIISSADGYNVDSLYAPSAMTSHPIKDRILHAYFENRPPGIGSNNWAVSGSKTTTGKPILCNDPHLSLGLPSIWFEVHLHTPDFNAYGVSFPGFPGIMIGFNDHIAWGETNVGQDIEDVFRIKWIDRKQGTYSLDGKTQKATNRIEKIIVKDSTTIIDTVRYTYWGPIFKSSHSGHNDLAMRWLVHDKPDKEEFMVFINALYATNQKEYWQATEPYIAPAQNFIFAASNGDIGMRVNGKLPAKYDQDGRFVEEGDSSINNWQAFIPKYQNPQVVNPTTGFVQSSNQVSTDKSYPYYYNGRFERYRNRSVIEKLSNKSDFSVTDMQQMQLNNFSYKAKDYVDKIFPSLANKQSLSPTQIDIINQLKNWNCLYDASKTEPTLFEIFIDQLETTVWKDIIAMKDSMDVVLPEDRRLFEILIDHPNHPLFDDKSTSSIETSTDLLVKAVQETEKIWTAVKNEGTSTWGKYKPLHIYHLTRLPAFSEMNIEASGSPDAINAVGKSYGPSWRMIVSLEDNIKAWGVFPGGQSGNPTSKFYKNMINSWVKGEYYPLHNYSNKNEVLPKSTQIITLLPKKS